MSHTLSYSRITDARASISDIYDLALSGLVVDISRENDAPVTVVRKDDLKDLLRSQCALEPKVNFSRDGQISIWLEGLPISAQGSSLDEAETELIGALRDFASTWMEDLRHYPNHKKAWALPALVRLSDDGELRDFLFGPNL